jgi:hypothetical protein
MLPARESRARVPKHAGVAQRPRAPPPSAHAQVRPDAQGPGVRPEGSQAEVAGSNPGAGGRHADVAHLVERRSRKAVSAVQVRASALLRLWWKLVVPPALGAAAGEPAWEFDSPQAHRPGGRGPGLTPAAAGGEAKPRNPVDRRRPRAYRAGAARRWIGATAPERGRCRFESGRAPGVIAQSVERGARNAEAWGSTPHGSTNSRNCWKGRDAGSGIGPRREFPCRRSSAGQSAALSRRRPRVRAPSSAHMITFGEVA